MEIATLQPPENFPETILRCIRCAADNVDEKDVKKVLSKAEQTRYQRLKSLSARRRFAAGRLGIRLCLAELLGLAADEISITQTPTGKPLCEQGWQFSISHDADWVLLALHPHSPVGVDLVAPKVLRTPERLLKRLGAEYLVDSDNSYDTASGPDLNQEALKRWNRNEALMKSLGYGIAQASKLRSLGSGRYQWDRQKIQSQSLNFTPAPDYLASFAIVILNQASGR